MDEPLRRSRYTLPNPQFNGVADFLGGLLAAWAFFHYTEVLVGSGPEPL